MRLTLASLLLLLSGCGLGPKVGAFFVLTPLRLPVIGEPRQPHQRVHFRGEDGTLLEGWLLTPQHAPRGLVVLLHGKDSNRQHLLVGADRLLRRGYAVLAYDQRGHGRSQGELCTYGAEEVGDLRAALRRMNLAPVYVIGESLGAAVALQAAAQEPAIQGVVAAASFSDLRTIVEERAPPFVDAAFRARALEAAGARGCFQVAAISPADAAAKVTVPVLLLHGTEDDFTAPAHSRRIFARLAGPKRMVWLDGVGHADVLQRAAAWDVVERWLDGVTVVRSADAQAAIPGTPHVDGEGPRPEPALLP